MLAVLALVVGISGTAPVYNDSLGTLILPHETADTTVTVHLKMRRWGSYFYFTQAPWWEDSVTTRRGTHVSLGMETDYHGWFDSQVWVTRRAAPPREIQPPPSKLRKMLLTPVVR
jgi:hypothetical protein